MKKIISIIIPVFNEEKNVPLIYHALRQVWEKLPSYDYEYIFVNDGSKDKSSLAIEALAANDKNVKCVEFSRNFGKEMATTAGIEAATGDAVIIIDADLQHPAELIPQFVSRWENGAEIVIGVRTRNKGEGFTKKMGSWLFYKIMSLIPNTNVIPGETDFRLIDRMVANAFNGLSEQRRMTRSLINWLGFKKEIITFEANARMHGEAAYSTSKLIRLALYSLISNSLLPLRITGYLGIIITFLSGLLGGVIFFELYIFGDPWNWNLSGSGQLAIIIVFLVGIILMALGIIALYIENMHTELSDRPLYVVRKRINL